MSNSVWRRHLRQFCTAILGLRKKRPIRHKAGIRVRLEELEDRLAPAAGITASNAQLLQTYGQLPISFEANAGQTDAQVRYLAHGSGYALFLTSTGAVLDLEQVAADAAKSGSAVGAGLLTPPAAPKSVTGERHGARLLQLPGRRR